MFKSRQKQTSSRRKVDIKKIGYLGYGYATYLAKKKYEGRDVYLGLLTRNSNIILTIHQGEFYKLLDGFGNDLKITPNQFANKFYGEFKHVPKSVVKINIPATVYQKIVDIYF